MYVCSDVSMQKLGIEIFKATFLNKIFTNNWLKIVFDNVLVKFALIF